MSNKYLNLEGLSYYTGKLISYLHMPFNGFIKDENILNFISKLSVGDRAWCNSGYAGSSLEGNSKIELLWTQNTKKAVYWKSIEIDYVDSDGNSHTYSYIFNSKTFYDNNTTVTLNNVDWLLSAVEESGLSLYCGYDNTKGQQLGSSSQKATSISISTSAFSNCTITGIRVESSGASSTKAILTINVGTETSYFTTSLTSTNTLYEQVGDVELGSEVIDHYTACFVEKTDDGYFKTYYPSEKTLCWDKLTNKLYTYLDSDLTEIKGDLELGYTSETAYRGDLGQRNYEDLQHRKENIKFEYNDSENYWKVTDINIPTATKFNLGGYINIEVDGSSLRIGDGIILNDNIGQDTEHSISCNGLACNSIVSESGNGTLLLEDIDEIRVPWALNFDVSNLSYNGRTIATVEDATFCQDITYKDLKTLRDEGKLKPGRQYKIIDYDTITNHPDLAAAGHPFDIIVTADTVHTLNETARAARVDLKYDFLEPYYSHKPVPFVYKLIEDNDEIYEDYGSPVSQVSAQCVTARNQYGEFVPALIDPDPEKFNLKCYNDNFWVYALLNEDGSVIQDGWLNLRYDHCALDLEYENGVPVIYIMNQNPEWGSTERVQKLVYIGDQQYSYHSNCNRWQKYKHTGDGQFEYLAQDIISKQVVVGGEFLISKKELWTGLRCEEYIPSENDQLFYYKGTYNLAGTIYDWWENPGQHYSRLTPQIIDTSKIRQDASYFKESNLAAWELKYSLEPKNRWDREAEKPDQAFIGITFNDIYGECPRMEEWDNLLPEYFGTKYVWKMSDLRDGSGPNSQVVGYSLLLTTSKFPAVGDSAEMLSVRAELIDGKFEVTHDDNYLWIEKVNIPTKGFIYYMKDEFGNEASYDFKNILVKADQESVAAGDPTKCYGAGLVTNFEKIYTFNLRTIEDTPKNLDLSVIAPQLWEVDGLQGASSCSNNKVWTEPGYTFIYANCGYDYKGRLNTSDDSIEFDNNYISCDSNRVSLIQSGDNINILSSEYIYIKSGTNIDIHNSLSCKLLEYCNFITIKDTCYQILFNHSIDYVEVGSSSRNISIGNNSSHIKIGALCDYISLPERCKNITLDPGVTNLTLVASPKQTNSDADLQLIHVQSGGYSSDVAIPRGETYLTTVSRSETVNLVV